MKIRKCRAKPERIQKRYLEKANAISVYDSSEYTGGALSLARIREINEN